MTQGTSFFGRFLLAMTLVIVPAANAQTIHFAGSGASANWQNTALATFAKSLQIGTGTYGSGVGSCAYHFTAKGNNADLQPASVLVDARSSSIPNEPGNVWVVWIGDCNASNPGTTNVTDIWLDVSVDSTVGVRALYAATKSGTASVQGAQVSVDTSARTSTDAIAQGLWANDTADTTPLPSAVLNATNAGGGIHVNVALSDARPEDALFGTLRALAPYNATTLAGLGYNHGPNTDVGNSIVSSLTSTSIATPVKFALSGTDPISHAKIARFTTLPVGAAPVIYIMNDGGSTPIATDIEDGLNGPLNGEHYPLANLLDGTTSCDPSNAAFNGTGVGTNPLTVFLREPLSGTMNVNEYSVVRIEGTGFPGSPAANTNDSQEKGVSSTTTTPFNPLNLQCGASHSLNGFRRRGVGTSDIVTGIKNTSDSLGYIQFSFGNVSPIAASKQYNYLTLDGVDPLAIPGTAQQELPKCSVPNCTAAAVWTTGPSYPSLRDGTYRDWSIYRWIGQPGTAHFCADNSDTNPIAVCQPQATLPKTNYSKTTGKLVVYFPTANAFPFFVGQTVTLSGYTGKDAPLNGTSWAITAATDSATTHDITLQVGTGKTYETSDLTDPATVSVPADAYGVQALAQAAQDGVDNAVADFVPFSTSDKNDGLNVYRSHNNIQLGTQTITGDNGSLVQTGSDFTHGGGLEAGTDLGGCQEVGDNSQAGVLGCKQ